MAKSNTNTTENIGNPKGENAAVVEKKLAEQYKKEKPVDLFIPEQVGIQNPLPVSINGVQYVLPLGENVKVPEPFYNFIMNETNIIKRNT